MQADMVNAILYGLVDSLSVVFRDCPPNQRSLKETSVCLKNILVPLC